MDNFSGFPSLNFLLTFESVARHLSFTNAAKELCVTQAAVSHQIKALEDYLGSKLFLREKRRIFLSEEGQQLLPSVVSGLQGIADSIDSLRTDETEDTLVVGVGSSFSANWLVHRLGTFYQKFPDINLHLKISNNNPDFNTEKMDMAVVWGKGEWEGLVHEQLMVVEFTPVCSPDLLQKDHPLNTPEDLIHYPLLDDFFSESWKEWLELAGLPDRKYKRRALINDSNVFIQSALDGHGIGICAVEIVQEYLDTGRLVRPFELSITGGGFYFLVYPENALQKHLVCLFKDWLLEEVRKSESIESFRVADK